MIALALALAACTPGTEDVPPLCPTNLPRIASVTIERNGARAWREPDRPTNCTGFRLTKAQVIRYLQHARTTDARSADATLDRSPCYASGRVRFVNGRVGQWRIEQFRQGRLTLPGRPAMILYCPQCRARPFAE